MCPVERDKVVRRLVCQEAQKAINTEISYCHMLHSRALDVRVVVCIRPGCSAQYLYTLSLRAIVSGNRKNTDLVRKYGEPRHYQSCAA